jgi:hypothetical protein
MNTIAFSSDCFIVALLAMTLVIEKYIVNYFWGGRQRGTVAKFFNSEPHEKGCGDKEKI